MPAYVAICRDHPGERSRTLRREHLAQHLAYVEEIMPSILVAGPVIDGSDGHCASLLVYRADSLEQARELLENDPYFRAGIFASHSVEEWKPVAGEWVGGAAWKKARSEPSGPSGSPSKDG